MGKSSEDKKPQQKRSPREQKKVRIFGRISDPQWERYKSAAQASGKSFTRWASDLLDAECQKMIRKSRS